MVFQARIPFMEDKTKDSDEFIHSFFPCIYNFLCIFKLQRYTFFFSQDFIEKNTQYFLLSRMYLY